MKTIEELRQGGAISFVLARMIEQASELESNITSYSDDSLVERFARKTLGLSRLAVSLLQLSRSDRKRLNELESHVRKLLDDEDGDVDELLHATRELNTFIVTKLKVIVASVREIELGYGK